MYQLDGISYIITHTDHTGRQTLRRVFGNAVSDPDWCAHLTNASKSVEVSDASSSLPGAPGGIIGDRYESFQSLVFDLVVWTDDQEERAEQLELISDLMVGLKSDLTLEWIDALGTPKTINGLRLSSAIEPQNVPGEGHKTVQLAMTAPDPRTYSQLIHTTQIDGADVTVNPTATVIGYSAGNAPSWPVFYLHGPLTSATIEGESGVLQINVPPDRAVVAGDHIRIDTNPVSRSVLLNSLGNIRGWVDIDVVSWFTIDPRETSNDVAITFEGSGVTSAVEMRWRSAWWVS